MELSLDQSVFEKLKLKCPNKEIDLFASRLNLKLPCYVSCYPEPDAWAVDAFALTLSNSYLYIFPLFSLIPRILQTLEDYRTKEAIQVAPIWTTQIWWPCLVRLICGQCFLLPNPHNIRKLSHKQGVVYPLRKMKLAAFHISGDSSRVMVYQKGLPKLSLNHGSRGHKNSTTHILNHGLHSSEGKIIPLIPK